MFGKKKKMNAQDQVVLSEQHDSEYVLEVSDLVVHYELENETVEAVNGISLRLKKGETIGLVGETGAGKSSTALAILNMVPDPPGVIKQGTILVNGHDMLHLKREQLEKVRGKDISIIFQDPMTSLNPVMTVGDQIAESVMLHEPVNKAEAMERAKEMLELVGIPGERAGEYPHQFSGGMKQRVVIAIALSCNPKCLLADEPTTALDVTIQAQVLDMMNDLKNRLGTSLVMITHDLGVIAAICHVCRQDRGIRNAGGYLQSYHASVYGRSVQLASQDQPERIQTDPDPGPDAGSHQTACGLCFRAQMQIRNGSLQGKTRGKPSGQRYTYGALLCI